MNRLGFVRTREKRGLLGSTVESDASRLRASLRHRPQSFEEDDEEEKEAQRRSSLRSLIPRLSVSSLVESHQESNGVLLAIEKRFRFYLQEKESEQKSDTVGLSRLAFGKMVRDVLGRSVGEKRVQQLFALGNTHHDNLLTFDELVAFCSLSLSELARVALRLRTFIVQEYGTKYLRQTYEKLKDKSGQRICVKKIEKLLQSRSVDMDEKDLFQTNELTPGELARVVQWLGDSFRSFKEFMRADADELRKRLARDDRMLVGTKLTSGVTRKQAEELKSSGFSLLCPYFSHGGAQFASKKHVSLWVKFVKSTHSHPISMDDSESESESESESGSEAESDSDSHNETEEKETSEAESDSQPIKHRGKRQGKLGRKKKNKNEKNKPNDQNKIVTKSRKAITEFEVATGTTDAGLLADGFDCLPVPVSQHILANKSKYLWVKSQRSVDFEKNDADIIVDIATTTGSTANFQSSLWSPPCRGFKRFGYTFRTNRNKAVFLWYRKRDASFAREYLGRLGSTTRMGALMNHSTSRPYEKALEKRVREIVRERLTQQTSRALVFQPEDAFDKVAPHKVYLTKKQFVVALRKIGVQLSNKELALIFDKLDVNQEKKVHRDDLVEFFELSDREIESILHQMKAYMRKLKHEGGSLSTLFNDLDYNKDGKVSVSEVQELLRRMGVITTPNEVERLVDRIDTNKNGYLELDELVGFFHSVDVNDKSGLAERMLAVNPTVKRIAHELHKAGREKASRGPASGKLSNSLDVAYAWDRLVTSKRKDNAQPDLLDVYRIRAILKKRGMRVRREDAALFAKVIDPKATKQGGVGFDAFASFLRDYELPSSRDLASPGRKSPRSPTSKPTSSSSSSLAFAEAIMNLHADLNAVIVQRGGSAKTVFGLLFGTRGSEKISTEEFLRGFETSGVLRAFPSQSDKRRLVQCFDRDSDGKISYRDLERFVRQSSEDLMKSITLRGSNFPDHGEANVPEDRIVPMADVLASKPLSPRTRVQEMMMKMEQQYDSQASVDREEESSQDEESEEERTSPRSARSLTTSTFLKKHRRRISKGNQQKEDRSPSWWLPSSDTSRGLSESESDGERGGARQETFVSKLIENDMRKGWVLHLEQLKKLEKSESSETLQVGEAVNIFVLQAAMEDAVRLNGGPLELHRAFHKQDKEGNGKVSKRVFKRVLEKKQILIPSSEHKALARVLQDTNDGKQVNYQKFLSIIGDSSEIGYQSMAGVHARVAKLFRDTDYMFVFEGFDRMGDGTIHHNDFKKVLRLCDVDLCPADWKALRPHVEKKGRINYFALRDIIETGGKAELLLARNKESEAPMDTQKVQRCERMLFKELAASEQASVGGTGLASSDLLAAFESFDRAGLGTIKSSAFLKVLNGLVERLGLTKSISPAVRLEIAKKYSCGSGPNEQFIKGGILIDYVSFCESFENSPVHVDEAMILGDLAQKLHNVQRRGGLSYLAAMKAKDEEGFGFITRYAFRRALRHDLGVDVSEPGLRLLMELANTQGDGMVDYNALTGKLALESSELQLQGVMIKADLCHRLGEAIRQRGGEDPTFDLRLLFKYFSKGRDDIRGQEMGQLIQNLGLYVQPSELETLCPPGKRLRYEELERLINYEEEEWDGIASRVLERLNELERQGMFFQHECEKHKDPEESVQGIKSRDFIASSHLFGLPLSKVQLERIIQRFTAKDERLVLYGHFLDFVQARGTRW